MPGRSHNDGVIGIRRLCGDRLLLHGVGYLVGGGPCGDGVLGVGRAHDALRDHRQSRDGADHPDIVEAQGSLLIREVATAAEARVVVAERHPPRERPAQADEIVAGARPHDVGGQHDRTGMVHPAAEAATALDPDARSP